MSSNEEYLDNLLKSMEEKEENVEFINSLDTFENQESVLKKEESKVVDENFNDGQSFDAIKDLSEDDILNLLNSTENDFRGPEDQSLKSEDEIDLTELLQNMDETNDDLSDIKELLYKDEMNEMIEQTDDSEEEDEEESQVVDIEKSIEQKEKPFRKISSKMKSIFAKKNKNSSEDDSIEIDIDNKPETIIEHQEEPDENQQEIQDELGELSDLLQSIDNEQIDAEDNQDLFLNDKDEEFKNKEIKKDGLIKKFINFLMEEDDEEEEPKNLENEENITSIISEENQEILDELSIEDQEDKKKKKKKKKKQKNISENDEENDSETEEVEDKKKKKKEKKNKKEKNLVENVEIVPSKKLPKRKVNVTIFFALTIMVAILLCCIIIPELFVKKNARKSFYEGDYETCFESLYGTKLSVSDQRMYEQSILHLSLKRKMKSYDSFMSVGEELRAIDVLFQAISNKEFVMKRAEEYDMVEEIEKEYDVILDFMFETYGVTEQDIVRINNYEEDATYTLCLKAIVEKTELVIPEYLSEDSFSDVEKEEKE